MGEIASLIPVIQGGAQAAQSYEQGQASKMVAGINAGYAKQAAQDALRIGETDAGRRMMQGGPEASAATAHAAGQGILVGNGSAADVQASIKDAAIQDAATIRLNAAKQAWGYGVEASNYKMQGRFAEIQGWTGAANSIAGGGMRYAYDQYSASRFAKPVVPPYSGGDATYPGD